MHWINLFFFGVYPYICLSIFTLGLIFRYMATPGEWNARSSNLFAQKSLAIGSYCFHYGIIIAFLGHFFGLLTPTAVMNVFGFSDAVHTAVASFVGIIIVPFILAGLFILLWRHYANASVWATTYFMDIVILVFIIVQSCLGGWQDYCGNYNVFDTVAPWIRGVLYLDPKPDLMLTVPCYLKLHVVVGFTIFAMVPFSRLVHFISIPVFWFIRPLIAYRKRYENL